MSASGFLQRLVVSAGVTPPAPSDSAEPVPVVRPLVVPLFAPTALDNTIESNSPEPGDRPLPTRSSSVMADPPSREHRGLLVEPASDRSQSHGHAAMRTATEPQRDEPTIGRKSAGVERDDTHESLIRPAIDEATRSIHTDVSDGSRPTKELAQRQPPAMVEVRHTHEIIRPADSRSEPTDVRRGATPPPSAQVAASTMTPRRSMESRRTEHDGSRSSDDRVVHVTIGRIEIRTAAPSARQANGHHRLPAANATKSSTASLDQYLADRADRTGR